MRNKKGRCHPGRNPFRAKQHRRTQIGLTDSRYRIHILPDQSLQYAGFQVVGAKFKSFYKLSCYNPLPQILFHPLPCCENCPFVVSAKCSSPLQLTSSHEIQICHCQFRLWVFQQTEFVFSSLSLHERK